VACAAKFAQDKKLVRGFGLGFMFEGLGLGYWVRIEGLIRGQNIGLF